MYTTEERKELDMQIDMLNGNIYRMCVSDDVEEVKSMYEWAKKRIDEIAVITARRFINE